jgi:hypothetical protein
MARKYLVSIDLNKNELLNARIQNLGAAPSNPVSGQIYFDSSDHFLYFFNGTQWLRASGDFGTGIVPTTITPGDSAFEGTSSSVARADHQHAMPIVNLGEHTAGNYVAGISGTTNQITVTGSGSEGSTPTISLPADVTVSGSISTGTVNATTLNTDTLVTDGNVTVGGDLQVDGNLNVNGTVNAINRTEVNLVDNTIKLNTDFSGTPITDAGIIVERGDESDVSILWKESATEWQVTNDGAHYHAIARKYAETLSSSSTSYSITHNLDTTDVIVQIYQAASPYAQVEADVKHTDADTVTIDFAVAPSAGEFKVVVIG